MKHIVFVVVFIFFSVYLQADNGYIDSLRQILKQTSDFRKEAVILHQIADWYRTDGQYDEAVEMAELSLQQALEISDNNLEVTKAYRLLSNIYTNIEEFDKAHEYIDYCYRSAEAQSDPLPMAHACYADAVYQMAILNGDISVELFLQALSKIETPKQDALLVARIHYMLYGIYVEWNEVEKSFEYARKSIEYARLANDNNLLANAYGALAVTYTYKYQQEERQEDLDSVMLLLDEAVLLYRNYSEQVQSNTYAITCVNKASYYLRYYGAENPEIRKKIHENLREALRVSENIADNENVVASAYGMLSELSLQQNDIQSAENYLMRAYSLMLQKKNPYYHTLINVLNGLVRLSVHQGDFKQAFDYQQKITEYSGLLFSEESASSAKRLEAQFDFSQKEQEIELLKSQTESHRKQKTLFMGLIGIGVIGAFFMFRSYHFRLRYSLAREKQLTAERSETEMQIKYEKEEQARLKAEQELLELQQQKLQNEVMASQLQLQHKSEILQQVKEKLSHDETANIQQILREESLTDSDFEKARFHIQELHPNFFKNIHHRANQKLTPLDQKYCAYLYLGMETKQIALLLNVEPKSVRMSKYRLKQKFNLDAETDLVSFLKLLG